MQKKVWFNMDRDSICAHLSKSEEIYIFSAVRNTSNKLTKTSKCIIQKENEVGELQ